MCGVQPEEAEERAVKQELAVQLADLFKANMLAKSEMAARLKTSRAALDRLRDADNPSVTLAPTTTLTTTANTTGVPTQMVPRLNRDISMEQAFYFVELF